MASSYDVFHIHALDGGIIKAFSPRLIDQTKGFSRELVNFSLENNGMLTKRPAIRYYHAVPAETKSAHYFNQMSTGNQHLLINHENKITRQGNGDWVIIKSDLEPTAVMDFLTIADQIVATNGEDPLMIWNGTDLIDSVGGEKASFRTFLLYEHNDLRWTAKTAGSDGNNIRVRYLKVENEEDTAYVEVTGTGTEEDPYFVSVYVAWEKEGPADFQRITTTANDIITMVEAHGTADSLVDVELVAGSDGTRHVMDLPEQALVGGYNPVKGKFVVEYRLRAVLAGDPDHPSLLRLSHTGDPHLWSPFKAGSNAVEAYISPDDGEGITGLLSMGDGGVLIGKPNSLYGLFGYKRENFVIDQIDPNIGVASHRSMAYTRPFAYWVGQHAIYRAQAGGVPQDISAPIRYLFEKQVDLTRLDESVGFIYRNHYVISLPGANSDWVTLSFNIVRERWCMWDNMDELRDVLRVTDDPEGRTHVLLPSGLHRLTEALFADNVGGTTSVINAHLETIELDGYLPHVEKDLGDLYLILDTNQSEDMVNVEVYFDWEEEPAVTVSKVCNPVPENRQMVIRIPLGKTARFFRVKLYHESNSQFSPLSLYYTFQPKEVL